MILLSKYSSRWIEIPNHFIFYTQIDEETTVYEPTAGNGALLLLANPQKVIVNELNGDRAAALRAQGFTVTQKDASSFVPATEAVDRIITNPPFSSENNMLLQICCHT